MQRGEPVRTTWAAKPYPWGRDGLLVTLKVMALLAGYAMFVWITMTQLERRYLAPEATAGAGIGLQEQPVVVPGAVVIQGLAPVMLNRTGGRASTTQAPGAAQPSPAGAGSL